MDEQVRPGMHLLLQVHEQGEFAVDLNQVLFQKLWHRATFGATVSHAGKVRLANVVISYFYSKLSSQS